MLVKIEFLRSYKMKVKGTVKAWTTSSWQDFDYVMGLVKNGKNDEACNVLCYSNNNMDGSGGWTEVGVATITVDFFPREAIVSKQIEGLREQLRQHRVNAELAEQAILSQISKLTAIAA
jgi:hypothetical protein